MSDDYSGVESPNPTIKKIKLQKLPINRDILVGQIMENPINFLRKRSSFNEEVKENQKASA